MAGDESVYVRGQLSIVELNREVESFWSELRASDDLKAELGAHGASADEILQLPPADAIHITAGSAGIDPALVTLIVAFAPSVNHALKSAWDSVIIPWIRRRRGEDAIKESINKQEDTNDNVRGLGSSR